jgi:hypothetical protein
MTSPFPTRSRLSRSSISTPVRNERGLGGVQSLHSPSTPYDIYQRNHSPRPSSSSTAAASPRTSAVFQPSSGSQPILAAYRKSAFIGSPGAGRSPRYSTASVGSSADVASPRPLRGSQKVVASRAPKFIRRKTLKQRYVAHLSLKVTIESG